MNKKLKEFYEKKNPIAVMGVTNTLAIQILDVSCGIDDCVIIKGFTGDIHKLRIYESKTKGAYFKYKCNTRYYIKDFIKI